MITKTSVGLQNKSPADLLCETLNWSKGTSSGHDKYTRRMEIRNRDLKHQEIQSKARIFIVKRRVEDMAKIKTK